MNPNVHYLKAGDRVIVPKSALNLVQHHGIYIGYDENGRHWFAENHQSSGVRLVTAEQFLQNVPEVTRVQHFNGTELQRRTAVNLAMSMVGKPYDLLLYNCEHYSNEVQYGTPESRQVNTGLVIAGIVALVFGGLAVSR